MYLRRGVVREHMQHLKWPSMSSPHGELGGGGGPNGPPAGSPRLEGPAGGFEEGVSPGGMEGGFVGGSTGGPFLVGQAEGLRSSVPAWGSVVVVPCSSCSCAGGEHGLWIPIAGTRDAGSSASAVLMGGTGRSKESSESSSAGGGLW